MLRKGKAEIEMVKKEREEKVFQIQKSKCKGRKTQKYVKFQKLHSNLMYLPGKNAK